MIPKTCEDCKHFRQHYVRWGKKGYAKAGCGHCVYPGVKWRDPMRKACEYFEEIEKN